MTARSITAARIERCALAEAVTRLVSAERITGVAIRTANEITISHGAPHRHHDLIAHRAGQLRKPLQTTELYSEDLW